METIFHVKKYLTNENHHTKEILQIKKNHLTNKNHPTNEILQMKTILQIKV